jgi:IS30 family transposase
MFVDDKNSTGGNQMCQNNNTIKTKKFKQINYTERTQIERWHNKDKKSNVEIGKLLNRPESSIRRELKRGMVKNLTSDLVEIMVYSADVAQQKCDYNKTGKGPQLKIGKDFKLKEYIENGIKVEKKSPEILLAEIAEKGLNFVTKICAKTIRNNIHQGGIFELTEKDMIYKKEYKDKNEEKRVCSKVPAEKSIEFRPESANTREEYGHWEGDLVIGKREKSSALFTLTERKTREEIIVKISSKKAENVAKALDEIERKYKKEFYKKFKTITFDNGGEFRNWKLLEKSYDNRRKKARVIVYYAHPYCSGERGSNENNNRLIRRFIPKGMDITILSIEYIKEIENWINNYPRAMFDYKSTNQIMEMLCA